MATRTRAFGAGNRESHDASDFYARFTPPQISKDETVNPCRAADQLICGDARHMDAVDDNSVALVVTSPPYFAGKEYELALGEGGIPESYFDYLVMLRDVFAECVRVLEPGGRIAVNVANLGRKPYRSLAADVTTILQDELALLLRGEIIWRKAKGASGSCAFGSYLKASNPVMRDVTERVIVASKGRFDRAITPKRRAALGLPHESTISKEEFFAAALDVWDIRPESARRVKHPAPFPVELPERLIRFHTYVDDVVLDPFLGSGSTAVAAARNDRHYVGYDTDQSYVEIAASRLAQEVATRTP
jgi:site-specific DNA-methyltransferase (adenine-specific)